MSSHDFHQACLNELARSLTRVNRDRSEKEQLLLSHCPNVDTNDVSLDSRGLNAVTALGLFILEAKDECSGTVVSYLVSLLNCLPKAHWAHHSGSLLPRDFGYNVSLILSSMAAVQDSHRDKITSAIIKIFCSVLERQPKLVAQDPEGVGVANSLLLIGLCMGISGDEGTRREGLSGMFPDTSLSAKDDDQRGKGLALSDKQLKIILNQIQVALEDHTHLSCDSLNSCVPYYPDIGTVMRCGLMTVLEGLFCERESNKAISPMLLTEVYKLCKEKLTTGVSNLSSSSTGQKIQEKRWQEKTLFNVKSLCVTTRVLVWAIQTEQEGDAVFSNLSSMLTVVASKLNVVVSPLRATVLQGIGVLVEKFPVFVRSSIARFSEFLLSPLYQHMYIDSVCTGISTGVVSPQMRLLMKQGLSSYVPTHISRADAFLIVHEYLCDAVCKALLLSCEDGDMEQVFSFIGSLGNKLYTTDANDQTALRAGECIVMMLKAVAMTMGSNEGVVNRVLNVFQQRLFHPSSSLDGTIVRELGYMASSLGDVRTLELLYRLMTEALGMATTPYPMAASQGGGANSGGVGSAVGKGHVKHKRTESKDINISYSHVFQHVMDALVHVAEHLEGEDLRLEFLQRVLQSFVQQGIEGKKALERKEGVMALKISSSSFSLGLLLPVIATVCNKMEPIVSPSQRLLKLFRDFWLYCILLGFSDSEKGLFPPNWYRNVRDIAVKTPVLIFSDAEKYLDKELEINHPLKKGDITLSKLQEARLSLLDMLGRSVDLTRLVNQLTFPQCMYLQSIYRLEAVRIEKESGSFPVIYQYLEDRGLQKELWVAIEAVAKKLFEKLLNLLEDRAPTEEGNKELESHAHFLLFKFCHIRGRIKRLADHFLSDLVDRYPHLLWSRNVIHTMLDLLQELSLHVHSMDQKMWMVVDVGLPQCEHSITLPDNVDKREKTVVNFAKRCGEIIELALKWAPLQTNEILQDYISRESTSLKGIVHHSGISLATSLLLKREELNNGYQYHPSSSLTSRPDCLKDTRSVPTSSLVLQSQYMGGVKMALTLGADVAKLAQNAITKLSDAITDNGPIDLITSSLYSVTSLLIASQGQTRSLLHSLIHLPVFAFRADVLCVATRCWQWIITAREDLEYSLMRELSCSWQYTINERKGMFSDPSNKLTPEDVRPHVILIEFMSNRLEVVQTHKGPVVILIGQLLHHSLTVGVGPKSDHLQRIHPSISSCTARFSLLMMAIQVLKSKFSSNGIDRTLLREKLYNAALDYFCYPPSWIVGDLKIIREAMTALIKFWKSVKEIKNVVVLPNQTQMSQDVQPSSIPRNSSFWQALATDGPSIQGSWLNTLSSRSKSFSAGIPHGASVTQRSVTSQSKNKILLKRKNLILCLVKHEVERFSAWQNPGNLIPDLNIPGEEELSTWNNPTTSERNWQNTMTMAYQASPCLAFYTYIRFKANEFIAKEVTRLVQLRPVAFIDIPEAALLLIQKESVERDNTELYHLLYWRNIPPALALVFFTRPYSTHPVTAQFANKAMAKFNPADILLYIPQIIQALRYDKLGFARDYIITATKQSQLLAHQFLWNIQANIYVDEEGETKEPEIGECLETLSKDILNGLSGNALKFYKREFLFFKKVTDISGIIRPFPKAERRKECLKALSEVQLEPGVYLPSNPDSVVIGIDYTSGIPLQSAAKAPYLAKFKVKKFGIPEMENINTQDEAGLSAAISPLIDSDDFLYQGCIFKVGDDVRQDMLALQLINLFKDVFDGVNLDLYLVPYRVIATGAGCGVIECVPDSKSRDQLGKQTQVSLKNYFNSIYGSEESLPYQEARSNFIKSMAAYSLVTYLLQLKDRHNGNIMIDKYGHIIHIDFGFLFESSPGGNLGFEPDLKLTEEMIELMGGKKSNYYKWFLDLCVQGYLAVRPYMDQVVAMVTLMLDTGFPCFRGNTIEELKARFRPLMTDKEAARGMLEVVESSSLSIRTVSYDVIQDYQQQIYYHKKN